MPIISVVMSVYNDAQRVKTSVASILKQTFTDFEFIIINDGSTDDTGKVLDQLATQDARLRVIHQANTGLTKALIRGCAEAQGEFIARQDAGGDTSHFRRLEIQLDFFKSHPEVSLVACSASFIGPEKHIIYSKYLSGYELEKNLVLDIHKIEGPPHHGGTMFRKETYLMAGEYRPVFYVAQDIDLWLRIAEFGRCFCLPDVLYEAALDHRSITSNKYAEQFAMAKLAIESARQRRNGFSDEKLINSFKPQTTQLKPIPDKIIKSKFYYFLGSCLRKSDPTLAQQYFRHALFVCPLNFKALLRSFLG